MLKDFFYGRIEDIVPDGRRLLLVIRLRDAGETVRITIGDIHDLYPKGNHQGVIVASGNMVVKSDKEIVERAMQIEIRLTGDAFTTVQQDFDHAIATVLKGSQVYLQPMHNLFSGQL